MEDHSSLLVHLQTSYQSFKIIHLISFHFFQVKEILYKESFTKL